MNASINEDIVEDFECEYDTVQIKLRPWNTEMKNKILGRICAI